MFIRRYPKQRTHTLITLLTKLARKCRSGRFNCSCRLIKPIEIDYNFIEVEDQYLFDIAGKRFIKESGSLKGPPRAFISHKYNESKKPNPAPFIEGIHLHFSIYSYFNQSILKLNQGPKIFCSQL